MAKFQRPCMCSNLKIILWFMKWTGVFPFVPSANLNNHSVNGCELYIAKWWISVSILLQIVAVSLLVWITKIFLATPRTFSMIMMKSYLGTQLLYEINACADIILAAVFAKRMLLMFQKLSSIPNSLNQIGKLGRNITAALLFGFLCFCVTTFTWIITSWDRMPYLPTPNAKDSTVGELVMSVLNIITYTQIFVIMLSCLLVSMKYANLAARVERYFKQICNPQQPNFRHIFIVKPLWSSDSSVHSSQRIIDHLEEFNSQYRTLNACSKDINTSMGVQLMITLLVNFYILLITIFRNIASTETYNFTDTIHYDVYTIFYVYKLLLLVYTGYVIKNKSELPLISLQRVNIMKLSETCQIKIQTVLLQWLSSEPAYLSTFNLMNIGPWLIGPVIGNVITYLLVFLQ